MPFEDFSLRDLKIIYTADPEAFPRDAKVKISRTEEGVVKIECNGESHYENVSYNQSWNRIEAKGYVIRLGIVCTRTLTGDVSGGSWTAEDNPSGPPE